MNQDLELLVYVVTIVHKGFRSPSFFVISQNNSIDSLMQELRKWQEDTVILKEEKTSLEQALKTLESNADENKDLEEKYSELQRDFIELQKEVYIWFGLHWSLGIEDGDICAHSCICIQKDN